MYPLKGIKISTDKSLYSAKKKRRRSSRNFPDLSDENFINDISGSRADVDKRIIITQENISALW